MSSKMKLTGSSGRHDCSEWFKWKTTMMPCLDMTCRHQWTIANLGASCLPLLDEGSFKCLQRCSWRAAAGQLDSSEYFERHTMALSCPNVTSHSQLTIANLWASCLLPIDDGSFKCLQRCSWQAVPSTMMALNSSNDKLWHCFSLIWHPILSWQLPTGVVSAYPC